jgi:hypothetical protein
MTRTPEEAERDILRMALSIYKEPNERAAMRCALGDASALCDAIATDIGHQYRSRGRVTKKGRELALVVTRAADAIFAMRNKIPVQDEVETPT